MGLKYGVVVANVTEDTQDFWMGFKRTVKTKGMTYTSALEQAAALWLARQDGMTAPAGHPFADPAPVPFTGLEGE